jgi:hypothetical protein
MLMVIFGAGASFGSRPLSERDELSRIFHGDHQIPRPPLTDQLFGDRLSVYAARYPASRPIISRLRRVLGEGTVAIEEAIGAEAEAAARDPERGRHLLALRFYLWDLIHTETQHWWTQLHGFTHYADLLARLGVWRHETDSTVALVTFNYDQLLDLSLQGQVGGLELTSFDDYVARSDWRLYKLHGSVGWARVIRTSHPGPPGDVNALIARGDRLDFANAELRPVSWQEAVEPSEVAVAAPGVAVPTNRKQDFECPGEHLSRFREDVSEVQRLLLIGWRAAEPLVQDILAERISPGYRLGICDISDEGISDIRSRLGLAAERSPEATSFAGGFSGLLEGDALERWLEAPVPFS